MWQGYMQLWFQVGLQNYGNNNLQYLIMARKARIPYEFPSGISGNFMIPRWNGFFDPSRGIPGGILTIPRCDGFLDPTWNFRQDPKIGGIPGGILPKIGGIPPRINPGSQVGLAGSCLTVLPGNKEINAFKLACKPLFVQPSIDPVKVRVCARWNYYITISIRKHKYAFLMPC